MPIPPSRVGYVLYIDESGDDGFETVRPIDPSGGSEWMVLAGVLVHAHNALRTVEWVREFKSGIKNAIRPDLHFADLTDSHRLRACRFVASKHMRCFVVISNKRNMRGYRNLRAERHDTRNPFYNWMLRLLLERASNYCYERSIRDYQEMRSMRIEMASRGGLSLARTKVYLWHKLRPQSQAGTTYLKRGQISWDVINQNEIEVFQARRRAGLQLADVVASAFGQSIEPKPNGVLLAGELLGGKLTTERPFRAPHHSASMASLVGGGSRPRPGEVSLAHLGVLFLDELPEFQPNALDALRQPLEAGETVIARANHRIAYPSRIQFVAAMNPCKCGTTGPGETCRRGPRCASDYQARISGPLLDRIDMQIEVPAISPADLVMPSPSEGSDAVRRRVTAARERQRGRFTALGLKGLRTNADCNGAALEQMAMPDQQGLALLRQAAQSLGLSARGFHRTLKVARTIADLAGSDAVLRAHVAEALSYRGETMRRAQAA